jgi:molybdopterin converting factor small subunit
MKVRVVISGRNYHAAQSVPEQLQLPEGSSLDDALAALAEHLNNGDRLPESCLVAVSGVHLGNLRSHRPRVLCEGDELLLIAPVAGG